MPCRWASLKSLGLVLLGKMASASAQSASSIGLTGRDEIMIPVFRLESSLISRRLAW